MKYPRQYQLPSRQWIEVMLEECRCRIPTGPYKGTCKCGGAIERFIER